MTEPTYEPLPPTPERRDWETFTARALADLKTTPMLFKNRVSEQLRYTLAYAVTVDELPPEAYGPAVALLDLRISAIVDLHEGGQTDPFLLAKHAKILGAIESQAQLVPEVWRLVIERAVYVLELCYRGRAHRAAAACLGRALSGLDRSTGELLLEGLWSDESQGLA